MAETKPDVAIVVFNDHASAFLGRHHPDFALGCAAEFPPADEGWGPPTGARWSWAIRAPSHIAQSVILDEFDITVVQQDGGRPGLTVPLNIVVRLTLRVAVPDHPARRNVVMYPPPTGHRCFMLGRAIRRRSPPIRRICGW